MRETTPLGDGIARISGEIAALRSEVRLARRSWRATIAVLVVAIVTGGWLFFNDHQHDLQREQDLYAQDLAACERGNEFRASVAKSVDTQRDVLIAASSTNPTPRSTAQQQAFDAYNQGIDSLIAEFAAKDCRRLVRRP